MNTHSSEIKRILLSRTDNIGDVIFTLPMAGIIKKYFPHTQVLFLGKNYTKAIVECSQFVDEFYSWDEISKQNDEEKIRTFQKLNIDSIIHVFPNKDIAQLAKSSGIKTRIGTNRRIYHWFYCNKRVNLTRKNSPLHEAQLNIKLLEPLSIDTAIDRNEISKFYGFSKIKPLLRAHEDLIDKNKINVIFHPKSKGSAKEWLPQNYVQLAKILPHEKFNMIACGTKEEETFIQENILQHAPHIKNAVGAFDLSQYISFINSCDVLIAASTGPLHIAAALGKHALGLYPPTPPMSPVRWGPLGKKAVSFTGEGEYMEGITPQLIGDYINQTL